MCHNDNISVGEPTVSTIDTKLSGTSNLVQSNIPPPLVESYTGIPNTSGCGGSLGALVKLCR